MITGVYHLSLGTLFFYIINIALFYSQAAILQGTLGRKDPKYLLAFCMCILLLGLSTFCKGLGELLLSREGYDYLHNSEALKKILILDFVRSFFYQLGGTSYWFIRQSLRLKRAAANTRIEQLTLAGINAELQIKLSKVHNAFLQQQINPHLLFNTLNFVYSTIHKQSNEGGRAIFLLTEILDFTLKNSDNTLDNTISDEMEQVSNLIALNSFRFKGGLSVDLLITGDPAAHRIIPLVLLTLVENMFVHGDFKDHAARIELTVNANGLLHFETANAMSKRAAPRGRGTGLHNIRTRLAYAYPDNFKLITEEDDHHFLTKLTIQL